MPKSTASPLQAAQEWIVRVENPVLFVQPEKQVWRALGVELARLVLPFLVVVIVGFGLWFSFVQFIQPFAGFLKLPFLSQPAAQQAPSYGSFNRGGW